MGGRRVLALSAVTCVTSLALVAPGPAGAAGVAPAAVPASVCFPSTDNGDPALLTLRLTPGVVDVRTGAASISVTATASDSGGPDAASGVKEATLFVSGVESNTQPDQPRVTLRPTADGTLSGRLRIVKGSVNGLRKVSVWVTDRAGNVTPYSAAALASRGMPNSFVTRSHPDLAAPKLAGLRLSPSTVDTRRHARTVTVTARTSDDNSGVRTIFVRMQGGIETFLRRVAGGPRHGTWTGQLRIPRWHPTVGPGVRLTLHDAVGHRAGYVAPRLRRLGFPSHIRVIGPADRSRPTVSIKSSPPTTLDVRQVDGAISFVARVKDATSGVREVRVSLDSDDDTMSSTPVVELTRTAGTAKDGRWRGSVPLTRCATPAGNWTATLWAVDREGNARFVKLNPVVAVEAGDVTRPGAFLPRTTGLPLSGPVSVDFGEDVRGLTSASAVVQRGVYMRGVDLTTPVLVSGTWSCTTRTGDVADCVAGPVAEARFAPDSPFADNANFSVVVNPEHQLGVTDLAGNPDEPGSPGSFTAHGG
jgi:hypothetical protein